MISSARLRGHFWTPTVFTSLVGSYGETDTYNALDDEYGELFDDDGYLSERGKTTVYSIGANIGWKPVKGLQFVLQYDRVYEKYGFDGTFYGVDSANDASYSGKNEEITDRILFEAKRSF